MIPSAVGEIPSFSSGVIAGPNHRTGISGVDGETVVVAVIDISWFAPF
jgi:hypothetical protein